MGTSGARAAPPNHPPARRIDASGDGLPRSAARPLRNRTLTDATGSASKVAVAFSKFSE
jgi:hypothetical protein